MKSSLPVKQIYWVDCLELIALSKGPHLSDLIGHGSQPTSESLPGSLSERCGRWHSDGHPALLLVLSVLHEPSDWSELRCFHTQDVADGE